MPLPRDIVAALARRLAERAGLEPPAWVIESRAQARMTALGLAPAAYVELVTAGRGAAELAALIEAVRVGETRFFRQRAQIDALVDVVVPALAARGRRAVRVWSAGCASGEEPYTLALVLGRLLPEHAISVVATDVSDEALEVARRGVYPARALDHVPDAWRDGFELRGGEARVRDEVRAKVTFDRQNLLDGDAPRGCQLVWCRNVLIYFAADARRRAVERLLGALEPDGFLFVGYSEQLREVAALDAVRAGEAVVYVKRGERAARTTGSSAPAPRTPALGVPVARTPALGVPVTRTPALGVPATAPAAAPAAPTAPPPAARATLAVADVSTLQAQIAEALGRHVERLTIDLDGAAVLPDEVAPLLRRARAAAAAAGVALELTATRAGTRRWLRRHGLDGPSEATP